MANTTWNASDKSANITLGGTNSLTATSTSAAVGGVRGIDRLNTGKFYWEYTCTTWGAGNDAAGFATSTASLTAGGVGNWFVVTSGLIYSQNVSTGLNIGAVGSGGVVCVALDLTDSLFWMRLGAAGNWNGSGTANPATGVGGTAGPSGASGIYPFASIGTTSGHAITANFGDTGFVGVVPSGFTAGFTAGLGNTNAVLTQVAVEQWASSSTGSTQALLTQIGVEQWASVAFATPGGAQARAIILA